MYRVLGVSPSGYYAWRQRGPSQRRRTDEVLSVRRKGIFTTVRDERRRDEPDLVERDFSADAPDELYVADITYIPTWTGFLYLAIVLDVFSRRVVGWAMATHMKTELMLNALEVALWQRQPKDVIHHSDQGCQYTSIAFGHRCREHGVRPSTGSVGDCFDNAMAESFSPPLNASCWIDAVSVIRMKHDGRFSSSSKVGITRAVAIQLLGRCHR